MTLSTSTRAARAALAGVLVALTAGGAHAQPRTCPDLLAAAEQRYTDQVYMDVEPLVRDCLSLDAAPAEVERAYRLLALAYVKQSMFPEARLAIAELLNRNPSYTADPGVELPSYVAVVNEAREQLRAASEARAPAGPTASEPSPTDAAPGRVDVNTADAEALDTVPGIGPALAARIIAYREQNGAFRSAAEVQNVRGIGPRSIERMLPYLTAGGSLAVRSVAGTGPSDAAPGRRVDLNTATAAELETLPGIGPALAGRIVEFRSSYGPFRDLNDVLLVRGIGARKLEAIAPLVTVR